MSISEKVKRMLWASSGGYCGNPKCHCELFSFGGNGEIISIEEMAHIIAQRMDGPRGDDDMPVNERDEFDNLILLCPNCHTTVDKNQKLYPTEILRQCKQEHSEKIKNLFVAPKFNTREEVRKYLMPLFAENKYIFDTFGPFSENAKINQFATEIEWERQAIQKIIPNNRKIEAVIGNNETLLNESEFKLYIQFKNHREGFEFNKLSGDVNAVVPRFPDGFETIFE